MRSPGFWTNPASAPGLRALALTPLSWLWAAVTARRVAQPGTRVSVPVICVGNLGAGGAGKTPVVCALLEHMATGDGTPHALSRGYGGSEPGPCQVDPSLHSADHVGDEPLLLSAFGPAWVSRDRLAGAQAAAAAGASAIIMDDGFQNPSVTKDLSILVVDAAAAFGNGRVIPAGPLREPVAAGLARADLIVLLGSAAARARFLVAWPQLSAVPRVDGALHPLMTGMPWKGLRCLAFAGIGRPEKFFETLRSTGADIAATRSFADHARYPRAMVQRLIAEARDLKAQLVTTEKDAVRLPPDLRPQVLTLPVRLHLEDWTPLTNALSALENP